jgi:iron complex outermembrane receptor protein
MENLRALFASSALNGQGLSNAFVQVVTNNQPIYSYFMYEFRGYDAAGASIYADAAGADAL